jgi:uncharacterized protein YjgD (DUF1641 family)
MSSTLSSPFRGAERSPDMILEKLEDPRIVEALVSLLDKSDKMAVFAQTLEDFLGRSEVLLNSMSKGVGQLGRAGVTALGKTFENIDLDDLKSASGQLQGMLPVLRDFVSEFNALKEAGVFDAEVVKIIGRTGRAMAATVRDPTAHSTEARGIFNLLSLLKDRDVARSLNFLISFARHFGGDLTNGEPGSAPGTVPAAAAARASVHRKVS